MHESPAAHVTTREQLSEQRRRANRWYYPAFAGVAAAMVLGFATGEAWVRLLAVLLCVGANIALGYAYRNATGRAVPRLWQGRASLVALALLAVLVAAVILVRPAVEAAGSAWPAWTLAAAVFASTLGFGAVFERAVRLREARSPA